MKRITDLFPWSLQRVLSARSVAIAPARGRSPSARVLLALEALEDRTVPSTLTVTTPYDVILNGDGLLSLREAILIANDNTGATSYDGVSSSDVADSIVFTDSLVDGTILLNGTSLPTITSDLAITGLGAEHLTIDAQDRSQILYVGATATVEISHLKLTRGRALAGGAIFNFGTLAVMNATLSDNLATLSGGAISNAFGKALTVIGSTLSGNQATQAGGAIYNAQTAMATVINSTLSDNTAVVGGGIYNNATLKVVGSTLNGNTASDWGGAINNFRATVTVEQSTFSGNKSGQGGAIVTSGTLTVTGSTLIGNTATYRGGGISNSGSATLNNTIVAGNLREFGTTTDDIDGTVAAACRHNLIGDAGSAGGLVDGVNGNIVGNDGVGTIDISTVIDTTLADNGGPTLTHALVTGSPAIDAGDNSLIPADVLDLDGDGDTTEAVPFDQRGAGFPRILNGTVDIGAFELLQNQAPVVSDFTLVGAEDNALTFTTANFTGHYSDADGDALVSVRIESLPANGTLKLNGASVTAGQVIAAADLGNLVFAPALNFNGTTNFTYVARDGVSGFALTPATVTLHIQSAAEQAAAVMAEINALYTAGEINWWQAKLLKFELKGNFADALKVKVFLLEVNLFERFGILTAEQADVLRDLGKALLVSLTIR